MSTNCKTLSEYVPQLKFVKTLHILSSSVHNIIKSFKEPAEISVDKGQSRNQYWIPVIFGPSGYTALKTEKCLHGEYFINTSCVEAKWETVFC